MPQDKTTGQSGGAGEAQTQWGMQLAEIPKGKGMRSPGRRIVPPPSGTIWRSVTILADRDTVVRAWRDRGMSEDARFEPAPDARGTIVTVEIPNAAPGNAVSAAVATLTNSNPASDVAEHLRHFKATLEAGEVATTKGQPSGRESDEGDGTYDTPLPTNDEENDR